MKLKNRSIFLYFIFLVFMVFGYFQNVYKEISIFILLIISLRYLAKYGMGNFLRGKNLVFLLFILINVVVGFIASVLGNDYEYISSLSEKSYFLNQNMRYLIFLIFSLYLVEELKINGMSTNLKILNNIYLIQLLIGITQHLMSIFNIYTFFSQKYGYRELFILSGYRIDGFSLEATGYGSTLFILFLCRNIYMVNNNKRIHFLEYSLVFYLILYTFSRGVWLGILFSMIIIILLNSLLKIQISLKKIIIFCIAIITISCIYLINIYVGSFLRNLTESITQFYSIEFTDPSYVDQTFARPRLFNLAIESFLSSPIFGIGTGNYHKYVSWEFGEFNTWGAINDYLQILSENGIVGIILYLCFLIIPIIIYVNEKIKCLGNSRIIDLGFAIYIFNLILGISINNLLNPTFWISMSIYLYIISTYRNKLGKHKLE